MGLDTVELVMAFEEKFEITIPDEDAEKIVTVRDMIDYVYARVNYADAKTCLTQRAFYRLRRALQQELGLDRSAIRPATNLDTIIPRDDRQGTWKRLKEATYVAHWPGLSRSGATALAVAAASVAVGGTVYVANPPLALAFAVSGAMGSAMLLAKATEHLRLHFKELTTVGQLAEFLVARDARFLRPPDQTGWSYEQVRQIVRAIIVDRLRVEPTFSDDASFVDDLGAD